MESYTRRAEPAWERGGSSWITTAKESYPAPVMPEVHSARSIIPFVPKTLASSRANQAARQKIAASADRASRGHATSYQKRDETTVRRTYLPLSANTLRSVHHVIPAGPNHIPVVKSSLLKDDFSRAALASRGDAPPVCNQTFRQSMGYGDFFGGQGVIRPFSVPKQGGTRRLHEGYASWARAASANYISHGEVE